jgi:hypothetical protein
MKTVGIVLVLVAIVWVSIRMSDAMVARALPRPDLVKQVKGLEFRLRQVEQHAQDLEQRLLDVEEGLAWAQDCESYRQYPGEAQQPQEQPQAAGARVVALESRGPAGGPHPSPGGSQVRVGVPPPRSSSPLT